MMKRIHKIFIAAVFVLVLAGCGQHYQRGYQAGWEGDYDELLATLSNDYRTGYSQGVLDASNYKKGCQDASIKKEPDFWKKDNKMYIKGFRKCR